MEACRVYDDSYMMTKIPCSSEVLDSLWIPTCSPSFQGSSSMVNFEMENSNPDRASFSTQAADCKVESCAEDFDASFHQPPEKKRRLTPNQVKFLEKSFESDNKLEPDRKIQLAKELGLLPRQVAIWFQNRRARYKTKVLEKEYDSLKANYDKLKSDYDTLFAENEHLKNEVQLLTQKLLMRNDKAELRPESCDPMSPLDLKQDNRQLSCPLMVGSNCKQEEAVSSSKSDVFDSDSPHNYHNHLEPTTADSSGVENSDFDEDEGSLLQPKLELEFLQPNCGSLGFPVQDQGTWFWQY